MDEHDDLAGDLPVTSSVVLPAAALSWRFSRASGPGGQGVNTTDSRVELSADLSVLDDDVRDRLRARLGHRLHGDVLTVVAADDRSQLRNRRAARARMTRLLTDALAPAPPPRRPRTPSRRARARRVDAKRRQGQVKALRRRPSPE